MRIIKNDFGASVGLCGLAADLNGKREVIKQFKTNKIDSCQQNSCFFQHFQQSIAVNDAKQIVVYIVRREGCRIN